MTKFIPYALLIAMATVFVFIDARVVFHMPSRGWQAFMVAVEVAIMLLATAGTRRLYVSPLPAVSK